MTPNRHSPIPSGRKRLSQFPKSPPTPGQSTSLAPLETMGGAGGERESKPEWRPHYDDLQAFHGCVADQRSSPDTVLLTQCCCHSAAVTSPHDRRRVTSLGDQQAGNHHLDDPQKRTYGSDNDHQDRLFHHLPILDPVIESVKRDEQVKQSLNDILRAVLKNAN
jgi:hypothetical protein